MFYLVWVDGQKSSTQHITRAESSWSARRRAAEKYSVPVHLEPKDICARLVENPDDAEHAGILRDF